MIGIDLQNRKPIYEQIVERFQTLIVNGVLEPDSQMPSVRNLATELGINPNTIQRAYNMLEQSGYIYPVKGRGNFVTGGEKLALQKQSAFLETFADSLKQAKELGTTRAVTSMAYGAAKYPEAIFAVGNAPTALVRLYEMIQEGKIKPKLIIGVPVGFVNVVQSKELIMQADVPFIVAKGRKGGSNIAACICNALLYMLNNER